MSIRAILAQKGLPSVQFHASGHISVSVLPEILETCRACGRVQLIWNPDVEASKFECRLNEFAIPGERFKVLYARIETGEMRVDVIHEMDASTESKPADVPPSIADLSDEVLRTLVRKMSDLIDEDGCTTLHTRLKNVVQNQGANYVWEAVSSVPLYKRSAKGYGYKCQELLQRILEKYGLSLGAVFSVADREWFRRNSD